MSRRIRLAQVSESMLDLRRAVRRGLVDDAGGIIESNPGIVSTEDTMLPSLAFLAWGSTKPYLMMELLIDAGVDLNLSDSGSTVLDEIKFFADDHPDNNDLGSIIELVERNGGISPEFDKAAKKKERDEEVSRVKESPEKFEWNGFSVVNGGLAESEMKAVLGKLGGLVNRIKSKNFGHILYGPLIIVSDSMKGNVWSEVDRKYLSIDAAGKYFPSKDLIVVNADNLKGSSGIEVVVHELGHRQWFQFMGPRDRKEWTGGYEDRGFVVSKSLCRHILSLVEKSAPMVSDELGFRFRDWGNFDYNSFMRRMYQSQKKYRSLDAFDAMIEKSKLSVLTYGGGKAKKRRAVLDSIIFDSLYTSTYYLKSLAKYLNGSIEERQLPRRFQRYDDLERKRFYNDFRDEIEKGGRLKMIMESSGVVVDQPSSSSEYGRNNEQEDYAEAFAYYMMNKSMPVEIYDQFMSSSGLRNAHIAKELLDLEKELTFIGV